MNTRERVQAVLNFQKPDRMPMVEWASWWDETVARWRTEGLPEGLGGAELQKYFGLDVLVQGWFSPRTADFPAPAPGESGAVTDEASYQRLCESGKLYSLQAVEPVFEYLDKWQAAHRRGEIGMWFTLEGFFWFPRTLFGIEPHLYAFYDHPELMKRINREHAAFGVQVVEELFRRGHYPEFMTFAEDLSYNHGPMLSEEQFAEFVAPYYQEIIPLLKSRGVKVFIDTDGDVSACIAWFRRAGIEGILPLERRAGVDVNALRERYPDFLFIGGFDKTVMDAGDDALCREFARLRPAAAKSGYIVSCDHQTPPLVSLAAYRSYLKQLAEFAAEVCS